MITVLGASGYIGSALLDYLHKNNFIYFAPKRNDNSIFTRPLGDVIYTIGMTADFRTRPVDTARAHVSVLADIIEKADFDSLTYLSSTRVYSGGNMASPDSPAQVHSQNPSDLYNITKLAGESLCLHSGRNKTRVVRLSNVVGVSTVQSANFIDEIVQEALSGVLVMRTAPSSSKDYILLDDVVKMLPIIATNGTQAVYNLAAGRNIRNYEWTEGLRNELKCEVIYKPDAPVWIFPEIDIKSTVSELNFIPGSPLSVLPHLVARLKNIHESN